MKFHCELMRRETGNASLLQPRRPSRKNANVSLDDVAKRASVGIGTLYRGVSTREELLAATYSARFLRFAEASRVSDTGRDPLQAMRSYLEGLVLYSNV